MKTEIENKKPWEEKPFWFQKHWGLSLIILGVIVLIIIGIFSSGKGNNSTGNAINSQGQNSQQSNLASLNAEVNPIGNNLYTYLITNRNDYSWHNVTITIDSYYKCTSGGSLETGQNIMISGPTCDNWMGTHMRANPVIQSMNIQATEGSQYFTLQTIG